MKFSKETKVGIFTVAVLLVLAYFSVRVGKIHIFRQPTYTISAYFQSASGITKGTEVTMAGIKIGTVSKIRLEKGLAKIYMAINDEYKVYPQYVASIKSTSLLGENYISVSPVSGISEVSSSKQLDNEIIRSEISPSNMGDLISKFTVTADNLEKITASLKNSIGTKTGENNIKAILANIAMLSDNLNRIVYLNQRNVNVILANFASVSRNINSLSRNLDYIIANNKGNINDSISNIKEDTRKLNLTLDQVYGISSKINNGQGTLGKLVNNNSVYDNLNGSLKGIKSLVGGYSGFRIGVDMSSDYLVKSQGSVSQINLKLTPSPDHYYELGVASVPMGYGNTYGETQTSTYTTNNPPSGQFYPSSVTTNTTQYSYSNSVKFNVLMAKNFYNFTLLAGLLYSTGAIGVNYYVPGTGRNVKLYARAYGFNADNNGVSEDVNAGIEYSFYRHLFVRGGYDDLFNSGDARSVYVGGGIKFTDKDLQYLLVGTKMP